MTAFLKRFLYVLPAGKKELVPLLFAFSFVSVLETFGIGIVGPFVSLAADPEYIQDQPYLLWTYNTFGFLEPTHFIAALGLLVIVVFLLKSFLSWVVQTYVFIFAYQQQGQLAGNLIHSYLYAPYTFHLRKSSVHIIQSVTNDTQKFSNSILISILRLVSNALLLFFLMLLLCSTNISLILIILGAILPMIALFNHFKNKLSAWGKESTRTIQGMISVINHSLGGFKETRIIGCEPYFEKALTDYANGYAIATGKILAFKLSPRIVAEAMLLTFFVGFVSIYLLLGKDLRVLAPSLGIFALAAIRLIPTINNCIGDLSSLRSASHPFDRLYTDLKELENLNISQNQDFEIASKFSENRHAASMRSENTIERGLTFSEVIDIDAIAYHYPNVSKPALSNLTLSIKKGESVAFIGKSGAGKTTIVDVILGLLTPQSGDIRVDGRSIYKDMRGWQNKIGYIPQTIFLMNDTIEKNIAFGIEEEAIDHNRLTKAIVAAQLNDVVSELPDGAKTMVGERGVMLSGGQRQRIGIARALYHEREILILDEATAALDTETESLITEAINQLSGDKTILIIAHRLKTVERCDRIYRMEAGQIVASGSYQSVVLV